MTQGESPPKTDSHNAASVAMPEQITFTRQKQCRTRWCLGLVTTLLLVLATAVFVVLFVIYYEKDKDNVSVGQKQEMPSTMLGSIPNEVCTERACIIAAGDIAKKMDPDVDPCTDFADYACGGFYREANVPTDRLREGVYLQIKDENMEFLQRLFKEEKSESDPEYLLKIKDLFAECMDEDKIEELGVRPYLNSTFAKMWPTLNSDWDSLTFDLNKLFPANDDLPLVYKKGARNGSVVLAYQRYIENFAVELGAHPDTAKRDAESVMDLSFELAEIQYAEDERISSEEAFTITTISQLIEDPQSKIDYLGYVQGLFDTVGVNVTSDLNVTVVQPRYFQLLELVLNATDNRTIQNLFSIRHAVVALRGLTKAFRGLRLELLSVALGYQNEEPRDELCTGFTSESFWKGAGKEFTKEMFSKKSKDYVNTMVDNLKMAFAAILNETDWMGSQTKREAELKLKAMGRKIGFPDAGFNVSEINEFYQQLDIPRDNYYQARINIMDFDLKLALRELNKPVDNNKWHLSPVEVNAVYVTPLNEISFPAGILQPFAFSVNFPDSLNYGAIGSLIGHEITHGFDSRGYHYDHEGNRRLWWEMEDLVEFLERTQCVIDQYYNFEHPQIQMKLNGEVTSGENIADIGGLKESYRAYKLSRASKPKELPLPGLGLTPDQQFFLAFGQMWCQKYSDTALEYFLLDSSHSPGRFRIIGSLQNNEDFAKAFNCSVGSFMNPEKKCIVW